MKQLAFQNITKRFGKVCALNAVNLSIQAGQAALVAGPNGAGKSTLISILLGLYLPDRGTIAVDDAPVRIGNPIKAQMGYLPESVAFSENLSAWTMMKFYGRARGVSVPRMKEIMERIGLSQHARRTISGYSKGMRQRLALGISILHEPELLILDEPTSGLDQEGLSVLWSVVEEWRKAGRMTLISSHDLSVLEKRVDTLCILRSGEVVASDTPREIRKQTDLPVRVEFSLKGDSPKLAEILSDFALDPVTVPADRELEISVAQKDIVALMNAVFVSSGSSIASMQVIEPEMESIYEHLLEATC